ncbi:MAG: DUF6036 family nucleotidyltransferase [Candidatus Omnitrophota bacterium]
MMLYEEILREFQKQKVKYVLVGGMAVNLHGFMRSTADLDILVEMSDANLRKVVNILRNNGYRVKQPVDPMGIADAKLRYEWIHDKHMKAFNFYKEGELREVDIIIDSPVSFEKAKENAMQIKVGKALLPVISIDDLIIMKMGTQRSVDRFDIEALRRIKKVKGKHRCPK